MTKYLIPKSEITFSFSRSQGAGGQNVNKLNTKATLYWPIAYCQSLPADVLERFKHKYKNQITLDGMFILNCQEHRSQNDNIKAAFDKLQSLLNSVSVAPKKRRATKPTKGSKERRIKAKKNKSEVKSLRRKVL